MLPNISKRIVGDTVIKQKFDRKRVKKKVKGKNWRKESKKEKKGFGKNIDARQGHHENIHTLLNREYTTTIFTK